MANPTTTPTPETKPQSTKPADQQTPAQPVALGLTVSGIINQVKKTKNGKYYIMRVSTDSVFITVFTKDNGVKQGDFYNAKLSGLSVDQYKQLTAFEEERLG